MKRNKTILIFFIAVIALSVSALSFSLAWYASADFVQIAGLEMSVDTDKGLWVATSIDGDYRESLSKTDLTEVREFFPRTSAYASEWMDKGSDTPLFYDDSGYSQFENANLKSIADSGYFSQKLYLQSDDDIYVTINAEKSFIKANERHNQTYAEALYDEYQAGNDQALKALSIKDIQDRLAKLVNAMRFSILFTNWDDYQYLIIDPNKEGDTYYGGLLDNDVDRYYDSYVKESDGLSYERVYGEILGDRNNIVYDDPLDTDSGYEDAALEPSAFNARHKRDVKRFNYEKSLERGVEIKKEPSIDLNDFKNTAKPFQFPLYRYKPIEIVLSIYIEGWDLDSVNYTMGATFVSNLSFQVEREM